MSKADLMYCMGNVVTMMEGLKKFQGQLKWVLAEFERTGKLKADLESINHNIFTGHQNLMFDIMNKLTGQNYNPEKAYINTLKHFARDKINLMSQPQFCMSPNAFVKPKNVNKGNINEYIQEVNRQRNIISDQRQDQNTVDNAWYGEHDGYTEKFKMAPYAPPIPPSTSHEQELPEFPEEIEEIGKPTPMEKCFEYTKNEKKEELCNEYEDSEEEDFFKMPEESNPVPAKE